MPSSFVMGRRVRSFSETVSGTVTRDALSSVRKEEFCSEDQRAVRYKRLCAVCLILIRSLCYTEMVKSIIKKAGWYPYIGWESSVFIVTQIKLRPSFEAYVTRHRPASSVHPVFATDDKRCVVIRILF